MSWKIEARAECYAVSYVGPSFVLTIDVEPVGRQLDPGCQPSWDGLDRSVDLLTRLRETVAARTGRRPRFSWFARVDPQIEATSGRAAWILEERRALFDALEAEGDAIGLHVHAFRWLEERRTWMADHANAEWTRECVTRAVEAFTAARGRAPRLFRFGDRYLDNAVVAEIERLGFGYDLTVEAGAPAAKGHVVGEAITGSLPDTRRSPKRPYQPSRRDFRRPARFFEKARALWEVPVTTASIRHITPVHDVVHLNLGLDRRWIDHILAAAAPLPVVVSVARTGDVAEAEGGEEFRRNVEMLAGLEGRVFVTPDVAVEGFA